MSMPLPRARFIRSARVIALAVAVVVGAATIGTAATYTWGGGGGGKDWFSTGLTLSGNWIPSGGTLAPGDSLVFDGSGDELPNQNGNAQVTNLSFTGGSPTFYELGSTTSSTLTISGQLLNENTYPAHVQIFNPVQFVNGAVVNTQAEIFLDVLNGSGNFTKTGGNNLSLNITSAYSGTMTVSEGTFGIADSFGGSISMAANTAGYFGSARAVNQAGGLIEFRSGTVSQASTLNGTNSINFYEPISTMTFGAALTLGTGNHTTLRGRDPGVADKYDVNGPLTFGGTLDLDLGNRGSLYAQGTIFQLFSFSGTASGDFTTIRTVDTSGRYAGLTFSPSPFVAGEWTTGIIAGSGNQYLVFSENTGRLVALPEPSAVAMAALGAGLAGWQMWRGSRLRKRGA